LKATVTDATDSFLSRWSRRKAGVREGAAVAAEPVQTQALPPALHPVEAAAPRVEAVEIPSEATHTAATETPLPPTMADVALLKRDSDYSRFLGSAVRPEVKNAALKQLFTDPHFNVMDGLDTYIGDYNTPDPLPAGMLRQMVQSQLLGLFDDEVEAQAQPVPPTPTADPTFLATDENPALQLQPDHGAGRPGAETGAGAHAGRPD
jgi:hypothetical protein